MIKTQAIEFAISEFFYDQKTKRYRWRDGAGKGQFIAKSTVLEFSRRQIVKRSNDLVALGDRVADGDISLIEFQREAADILRQTHILQAVIAANGSENLFANDYLRVGRELQRQFRSGVGENGDRYGLKWLAIDIQEGKVSRAQLKARLKAFAASSKKSYWQIYQAKNEGKFAFRVLGSAHKHCSDCIAYAAEPPKPIEDVVLPAHRCQCLNQCVCSLKIYKSLSEAIEAKG